MTKSTITREQVIALTAEHSYDSALVDALEHLLSTMDSEPVGWTDEQELRDVEKDGCGYLFKANPITPHADPRRVILLYRHAQPAPKVMQSESAIADCDPEVYEKGVSVCLVAIPKETAEIICQNITAATGCKVDWHYFGGRVHIKALRVASQPAPVVPDAATAIRACLSEFPESARDIVEECADIAENACRAAMLAAAPQEVKP